MKKTFLLVLSVILCLSISSFAWAEPIEESQGNPPEFSKAKELYDSGKYEAAIKILIAYTKTRPEPKAYYMIAYSYYRLGKHDIANQYFEQAFLVDPKYSPTPQWEQENQRRLEVARPEEMHGTEIGNASMLGTTSMPEASAPKRELLDLTKDPEKTAAMPEEEAAPSLDAELTKAATEEAAAPVEEQPAPPPPTPKASKDTKKADKPSAKASKSKGKKDNTILYATAGFAGLLVILSIVLFVIAKKKGLAKPALALIPLFNILYIVKGLKGGGKGSSKTAMPDISGEPELDLPDLPDDMGLGDDDFLNDK